MSDMNHSSLYDNSEYPSRKQEPDTASRPRKVKKRRRPFLTFLKAFSQSVLRALQYTFLQSFCQALLQPFLQSFSMANSL